MATRTGVAVRYLFKASAVLLLAFTFVHSSGPALATTTYTWNNPAGGSFQTAGNWSPNGLPGASDTVVFGNPAGIYTVNFTAGVTTAGLQASQGTATLALAGQTYAVTGNDAFSIGTTSGQTASLKVTGGTVSSASTLTIGSSAGGNGSAYVTSANSKIQTNGASIYVGKQGTGLLSISGTSTTEVNTGGGSVSVGENLGSSGSIDLNNGTLMLTNGYLYLGNVGTGSILVHNAGTLTQSLGDAFLGYNRTGDGSIIVTGAGSTWSAANIHVGSLGTGSVTVQTGAAINAAGSGYIGWSSSSSTSAGHGTVNLDGGSWTSLNGFEIGDQNFLGGTGAVHVNSGGSLIAANSSVINLNSGGTLDVAGGAVTASKIVMNGGSMTWSSGSITITGASGLSLSNATFGSSVSLDISKSLSVTNALSIPSGQSLSLVGGNLAAGSFTGPGSINLQTGNLTITNSNLTVGSAGPLGALVTVGSGLNLRVTGAGQTLSVASDGVLNLTGGAAAGTSIANAGEINFGSPVATLGLAGQTLTNTGRLAGTGRVNANLTNNANGRISVDASQRLVFAGTTNNNNLNSTIEMTGGTVEFTGTLTNAAGGFISGRGTLRGSSANTSGTGLSNSGVLAFSGGTSDIYGKVQNLGGGTGGKITNAGGGTLTFHDDVINNGQEIRTFAGGRTVLLGALSGSGPFTGTGTVEIVGDLRPGNSPATVTFGGDLVLGSSSTVHIELGGTTAGTLFDQMQVAGGLQLDGALDVSLISNFSPAAGSTFDILDWGSRVGTFSSIQLPALASGLSWDTSQLYTSGLLSVGLTGDYNHNGNVDASDYIVWRKGLGTTYVPNDYNVWRANVGHPPGGGNSIANAAVPEPTTIGLLLVAFCLATAAARNQTLRRC